MGLELVCVKWQSIDVLMLLMFGMLVHMNRIYVRNKLFGEIIQRKLHYHEKSNDICQDIH